MPAEADGAVTLVKDPPAIAATTLSPTTPTASIHMAVAVPVPVPVPAPAAIEAVTSGTQTVKAGPKPKRAFPWMWLAVAVILLLGCLVTLSALNSIRKRIPAVATRLPAIVETLAPLRTPQILIDIAQAEQKVSQNPSDPNAYLDLAMAYAAASLNEPLQEAVTNIEKTAGKDESFLWSAGEKLAQAGSWVGAARLCVDAAELHSKAGASLDGDKLNTLHQVVYLAFAAKEASTYIDFSRIAGIDDPLAAIAKARYLFYNMDRTQGQAALDALKQVKPDLLESILLQAEFDTETGHTAAAREALVYLKSNANTPGWMLDQIKNLEGKLP
jgi:hypothetical protein